jgi:hypothetical protein
MSLGEIRNTDGGKRKSEKNKPEEKADERR